MIWHKNVESNYEAEDRLMGMPAENKLAAIK